MKKHLLLMALGTQAMLSQAQITITSADVPNVGDLMTTAQDTLTMLTPGASGANQTWNFGALLNHGQSTLEFLDPANTPYATEFPTANIAFEQVPGAFAYGIRNASEVSLIGLKGDFLGIGLPSRFYITPKDILAQLSMDFNDSYLNNHTDHTVLPAALLGLPAPIDSVKFEIVSQGTVNIDAWGMVTTPTGTYNALRQYTVERNTTTIYGKSFGVWSLLPFGTNPTYDTTYTYQWWSNDPGTGFPVLEMTTDNTGSAKGASYMVPSPAVSVASAAPIENKVSVYPNPASLFVEVKSSSSISQLKVLDMTGKLVLNERIAGMTAKLDVSALPVGSYILKIESGEGKVSYESIQIVR